MRNDSRFPVSFRDRQITIMGLGRFGGGVAATRFLAEQGARITLTDSASEDQLQESLAKLGDVDFERLVCGQHDPGDFENADLIVVNPAVPPDHPCIQQARRCGIPLTTELDLFLRGQAGQVIAVTGSNGKSTTTSLIHSMLSHSGQACWLGGNMGVSLLPHVSRITPEDWVILEISSFQLNYLSQESLAFRAAVVTGFTPNHLDWHSGIEDYRRSKQRVLDGLSDGSTAILPAEQPEVVAWPCRVPVHAYRAEPRRRPQNVSAKRSVASFRIESSLPTNCVLTSEGTLVFHFAKGTAEPGRDVLSLDIPEVRLPGQHNRHNVAAAATAVLTVNAPESCIQAGLDDFQPLPHRLQLVAKHAGIRFFNDSLATTPESTIAAIGSFDPPVSLILGGSDKGVDLSGLARVVAENCRRVACLGETAHDCQRLIGSNRAGCCRTRCCVDLKDALDWLLAEATPGETIVMSPACASYDMFRNFADRGDQFRRLVEEMVSLARNGKLAWPS